MKAKGNEFHIFGDVCGHRHSEHLASNDFTAELMPTRLFKFSPRQVTSSPKRISECRFVLLVTVINAIPILHVMHREDRSFGVPIDRGNLADCDSEGTLSGCPRSELPHRTPAQC